jgi:hypothetical protein
VGFRGDLGLTMMINDRWLAYSWMRNKELTFSGQEEVISDVEKQEKGGNSCRRIQEQRR